MLNYNELKTITKNTEFLWKQVRGKASNSVADKLDNAMLEWTSQLTETLSIWIDKGNNLTDGELILARVNIGSVVESWLKLFYCVYYDDYKKNPKMTRGNMVEPNKMSFEDLKIYSKEILFVDNKDIFYKWVEKIQFQRNAIHSFNYRDIGTPSEFLDDIIMLFNFVELIVNRFPPIEDMIESFPYGYILNPYEQ